MARGQKPVYTFCPLCDIDTECLYKHIAEEHKDIVWDIVKRKRKIVDIAKLFDATIHVIRLSVYRAKEIDGIDDGWKTCPRCKAKVKAMQRHITEEHAIEVLVAKKAGLTNKRIARSMFADWCSPELFRAAIRGMNYEDEIPSDLLLVHFKRNKLTFVKEDEKATGFLCTGLATEIMTGYDDFIEENVVEKEITFEIKVEDQDAFINFLTHAKEVIESA